MARKSKPAKTRPLERKTRRRLLLAGCGFLLVSLLGGWVFADWYRTLPDDLVAAYVGRDQCIQCHQSQSDLFHGSHHDLAMDVATAETVLADFNDQSLEHDGMVSRFFRDGERFMVHTEGPAGKPGDFEVKYVFGYQPLQQYMVELKPASEPGAIGTVQVLRLSWDTRNQKWFYLKPPDVDEKLTADDPLHWTGITQNWNTSCAFCHSTDLHKNFDVKTQTYNTTFSEIDVSCEACHGPGSLHVDLARNKTFFWDRKRGLALHNMKTTSNIAQIETCAACHSRRRMLADGYVAGCNLNDFFDVSVLQQRLYHCDGQIRDEVYVYGSYIQSKMFHNNIKCTDCHDPHSARVKYDDNRLCTSCHQHPASKYDSPAHHHHVAGSPGSRCVECHMPTTTYMAVDARRDHSLRVPRPDLSLITNAPNACSGCHLDSNRIEDGETRAKLTQYLDWIVLRERGQPEVASELLRVDQQMADAFRSWYPDQEKPANYGPVFQKVFDESADSSKILSPLLGRRSVPAFFRASAALQLAQFSDQQSLDAALDAISDLDPIVVRSSLLRIEFEISRLLQKLDPQSSDSETYRRVRELFETISRLLAHESRLVRLEVARVLTTVPAPLRVQWFATQDNNRYLQAFDELVESLMVMKERGSAHRTLASLYEVNGEIEKAIRHFETAIVLEPGLSGPRWNLAAILERRAQVISNEARQLAQGAPHLAVQKIEQATAIEDKALQLRKQEHQILLVDLQRMQGIAPTDRLHYQLGMSYYNLNDLEKTGVHLLAAYNSRPSEEQYVLALATYYHAVGDRQNAIRFVNELIKINPDDRGYQQLRLEIEQR